VEQQAEQGAGGAFAAALDRLTPLWLKPNHLTLLRMAGSLAILAIGLSSAHLGWAVAVGLFTGFSDNFDGWLARRRGQITELGAMLDPMADKLFALVMVIVLWHRGLVDARLLLLALAVDAHAVALPLMIMARRRRQGLALTPLPKVRPNLWGKLKTAWLATSLGMIFVGAACGWPWLVTFATANIWVGVGLGLVAMAHYFRDWRAGAYA
jgi:phosphatidylglycerophosphate synthase